MSGITSSDPILSRVRLADTLSLGYFTLLGTLSSDYKGLQYVFKQDCTCALPNLRQDDAYP